MPNDLMHAVEEIREHADQYRLAEQYYFGTVGELFTSNVVRRALRGAPSYFDLNFAKRVVDAVLDRVEITAVSVPDDEAATRRLIDTIWDPNRMNRYAKQVHWSTLVHGDCYVIAWPGEEDTTVELHVNSPLTTRVFYDSENRRRKSYAAKLWCEVDGQNNIHRINIYYADRIERFTSKPGSGGKQSSDWEPYSDDDQDPILDNPFGVVPVFHFRTSEPYGRPEHEDAYGPQAAITKLSSTMMSTVDFQAFPQRYALTTASDADSLLDIGDDGVPTTADTDDLEAGPGTLWKLPDATKVGEFSTANMDAFLKPLEFYIRAMATSTATPMRFLNPTGQIPSGEALRADEAPLAVRVRDLEDLLEEEWQELLVFASVVTGDTISLPDIGWRPVQTVDDLQGWQTVSAKQSAGVPARQALTEAGYTSELVEGWLNGSEKPNLDTRVATLIQIGQALQSLSAAVQLGGVSGEQVNSIIAQVLGDLVEDPRTDG
jgi:hypothetical protein